MPDNIKTKSGRRTPWTNKACATPLQTFIDECSNRDYDHRHPVLSKRDEAAFLNSYEVHECKFCESTSLSKEGYSDRGIQRYRCKEMRETLQYLDQHNL